jgi:hypothetical protein
MEKTIICQEKFSIRARIVITIPRRIYEAHKMDIETIDTVLRI